MSANHAAFNLIFRFGANYISPIAGRISSQRHVMAIRDGFISMGHGRAIINIEDLDAQTDIYQKIVSQNLSVRETETLVKNYQESLKPKAVTKAKASSFDINEEEKKAITGYFGAKVDVEAVIDGFVDALKKKQKLTDEEIITHLNNRAETLNKISQERFTQQLNKNLDEGKKYLANNAKNKKVVTTKSGLQYEMISEGKGEKPKPESIVLIHYKGSLLDGTVFDNTYDRKTPAHLSMINVVDGLQEGLMLMKEGEKARLVIPSDLAYGNSDVQAIPAGSTVIFDVELVKVMKPGDVNNTAKPLSEETKQEVAKETLKPIKKN